MPLFPFAGRYVRNGDMTACDQFAHKFGLDPRRISGPASA